MGQNGNEKKGEGKNMAGFVIECPNCGKYHMTQKRFFFFTKRTIDCDCGYTIHVKTDKVTTKVCPHCGNTIVYDQSKAKSAVCPVCKEKLNVGDGKTVVSFTCPTCACTLTADRSTATYTCPLCDTVVDVQQQLGKAKVAKAGVASLIKYEGDNTVFVWKHPLEDFNLGSQLIVHESQEALLFRNGRALDLFPAGRYTLETEKLPILNEFYKLPAGTEGAFHSEVYFINMAVQMGLRWGTDSKVRLFDPATGMHIELGASGQYNVRVIDSRKLVLKMVGTSMGLRQESQDSGVMSFQASFKPMILTQVKSRLPQIIKQNQINILEIDEQLALLSEGLRQSLNEYLADYGLEMTEFFVTTVVLPDDENFNRLRQQYADRFLNVREEQIKKETSTAALEREKVDMERQVLRAETEARMKVVRAQGEAESYRMQAQAEAEEMRMKGYTYQQETARQVGVGIATNSSAGGAGGMADIANLGMGLGMMGGVIHMTKDALNPMMETMTETPSALLSGWDCACGQKGNGGKFCQNCGKPQPQPDDTWDCDCGQKGNRGKFCQNCGKPRPQKEDAWDCECGQKGNGGKFCQNCGKPRPQKEDTWNCVCGKKGNRGKFCDECGKPRPAMNEQPASSPSAENEQGTEA